jgi:hypothetical protein
MLKQATESFFRLEFYKTPGTVSGTTLTCEPPTRQNRKLIFAKNLSLPLGEKYFYNTLNGYIHVPVFRGSNYSNKENMYLFWFADESVLTETNISGTTTLDKYTLVNTGSTTHKLTYINNLGVKTNLTLSGNSTQVFTGVTNQNFDIREVITSYDRNYVHGTNTFFMTAKFYNAKDGTILDFTNDSYSTGYTITEQNDMYYQVNIDKTDYSYQVYFYNGVVKCEEVGLTNKPIMFFERGGGTAPSNILYHICSNVTPTPTPTITPISVTPTPTPTPTITPTPTGTGTETPSYYNVTVRLVGYNGANGNLQVWQSSDNSIGSFVQSLTLTSTDNEFVEQSFNGTPGYYYYMIVARTSGTAPRLNLYTQVNITDFSPGPINFAWCSGPNGTPLQSDVFQLPYPIQVRSSIVFYGGLNEACL